MTKRPDMLGNQFAEGNSTNATSFKKGVVPWNKGRRFSAATRKKMSDSRKRFYRNGGIHPLLGKKRLDITGSRNPNWGRFGKEHPKWQEIKKRPFYKSIRQLHEYVVWRNSVFERDCFTCVLCGKSGIYVEADHFPEMFIDIVTTNNVMTIEDALACQKLWDANNGRTLCGRCHKDAHSGSRGKKTI